MWLVHYIKKYQYVNQTNIEINSIPIEVLKEGYELVTDDMLESYLITSSPIEWSVLCNENEHDEDNAEVTPNHQELPEQQKDSGSLTQNREHLSSVCLDLLDRPIEHDISKFMVVQNLICYPIRNLQYLISHLD